MGNSEKTLCIKDISIPLCKRNMREIIGQFLLNIYGRLFEMYKDRNYLLKNEELFSKVHLFFKLKLWYYYNIG